MGQSKGRDWIQQTIARWTSGSVMVLLFLGCPTGAFAGVATNPSARAASTVAAAPETAVADIPLASARAQAVTVPSAPDAWGGARSGSEPTLSDRVVSYRIEATLDPVLHTVLGHEELTWRNRSKQAVKSVYLHLYLNAFEGNGSTYFTENRLPGFVFRSGVETKEGQWGHIELRSSSQGGQNAPFTFVHPDGGPETDHTVVRVDLPTAVPAGASTTLEFNFFDQLPRVVSRTGYFGTFHLVGQWFPKIGVLELPGERGATAVRWNAHEFHLNSEFYADFGSFDMRLTVPQGMTVGATGEEVDAPVEKAGLVTHHFVQNDVHEFAWTADSRSAKPLEGVYRAPGRPDVKVLVIYPPEYGMDAQPVLQATLDSLAYFSDTLGPYPYKTVTAVIVPYNADEAGGMEYPTFFTVTHTKEVEPDTFGREDIDFTTIHEFGHGYFYGILASNEFEEPVLDEGMNEYWDQRMMGARGEDVHFTTALAKKLGIDPHLTGFEFEHVTAELFLPADPVGANSWDRLSSDSYATTYSRTATTLHDLEVQVGQAALERGMKLYYARWKFRHPSVADLEAALVEGTGQRKLVEDSFALEVYAAKKVDDAVTGVVSKPEQPLAGTRFVEGKWVEDTEESIDKTEAETEKTWHKDHPNDTVHGPYPYRTIVTVRRYGAAVPETLVVAFADGTKETVVWDDDLLWRRFSWVKSTKAVSAELDPERAHFLDANRNNNSLTVDTVGTGGQGVAGALRKFAAGIFGGPASRRWSSDLAAFLQNLLTLVATL
jgi:hypothetical protein